MTVYRSLSVEVSDTAALSSVGCRCLVCAIRGNVMMTVIPSDVVTMVEMVVVSVVRVDDIFRRHGGQVLGIGWNVEWFVD